jgi:hypothetical protein
MVLPFAHNPLVKRSTHKNVKELISLSTNVVTRLTLLLISTSRSTIKTNTKVLEEKDLQEEALSFGCQVGGEESQLM